MTNETQLKCIAEFLDKEDIRTLRQRYSELLDSGEAEKMGEVFTDDAVVKVTVGRMVGLPAICRSLKEAYQAFDTRERGHYPFMHAVTNHQIKLTGKDTATGSCYLLDFVTDRPQQSHPILLLGRYLDSYVRINGDWRIEKTELDVVWPGDE
eukprot:TRINITY_DN8672_c0_g2_i1.p1 TRINITY_DN8672_c0_g2~~TRINITY_DN8672_c0_g2_i1.p1  ORF type:complete len:152 (+),score=15.26 TRINITY_DN8672_c0_g2_i1:521-976(+)